MLWFSVVVYVAVAVALAAVCAYLDGAGRVRPWLEEYVRGRHPEWKKPTPILSLFVKEQIANEVDEWRTMIIYAMIFWPVTAVALVLVFLWSLAAIPFRVVYRAGERRRIPRATAKAPKEKADG